MNVIQVGNNMLPPASPPLLPSPNDIIPDLLHHHPRPSTLPHPHSRAPAPSNRMPTLLNSMAASSAASGGTASSPDLRVTPSCEGGGESVEMWKCEV